VYNAYNNHVVVIEQTCNFILNIRVISTSGNAREGKHNKRFAKKKYLNNHNKYVSIEQFLL